MMLKNHLYVIASIVLLLSIAAPSGAQTTNKTQDSLLSLLPKAKDDTNKVLLLCDIADTYFQTEAAKGVACGRQAIALSSKLKFDRGLALAYLAVGRCYMIQDDRPAALEHFQQAFAMAHKVKDHATEGRALSSIGTTYQRNGEYDTAVKYHLKAIAVYEQGGVNYVQSALNNLGNVYSELGKYKEALPYYLRAIALEEADGTHPALLIKLYNNAGGTYIGVKQYDSALYYLFKVQPLIKNSGNLTSNVYNLNNIGKTYLDIAEGNSSGLPDSLKDRAKNLSQGMNYEQQALVLSNKLGMKDIKLHVLKNITNIYKAQKKYLEASEALTQYAALQDTMYSEDNEKAFAKIEAEYKVKRTTDSLKYQNIVKDNELKRSRAERTVIIALIIFLGIIAILLISRQKLKHEQELKISEAEKLKAAELARYQLEGLTKSIYEKNELIEAFSSEIEKHKQQSSRIDHSLLHELQQSILLTDEQWHKFRDTFDKVHQGYQQRMKEKMPELTPAETRFIMLSKLKLSNKEMAAMLGVSTHAMRVSKHRLMKKLDIEDDTSLDKLIETI